MQQTQDVGYFIRGGTSYKSRVLPRRCLLLRISPGHCLLAQGDMHQTQLNRPMYYRG